MKRRDSMKLCAAAMGAGAFNIAAAQKEPVINTYDTLEYYPLDDITKIVCGSYCIVEETIIEIGFEDHKESYEADAIDINVVEDGDYVRIFEITPQLDSDQEQACIHLFRGNRPMGCIQVTENKTLTFIKKNV